MTSETLAMQQFKKKIMDDNNKEIFMQFSLCSGEFYFYLFPSSSFDNMEPNL